MTSIRSSFCKDLHAKCYLNEREAIITSMNLYEFSQINNNEMGVYVEKETDPELYKDICDEAQRLIRISDEIIVSIEKAPKEKHAVAEVPAAKQEQRKGYNKGYCIRSGVEIPFNPERPLSYEAFQVWNQFGDIDYQERFCHFSGEHSKGETSVRRPILRKNWQKAKNTMGIN